MESEYPKIGPLDLGRFHAGKGINVPSCWICGETKWFLQSSDDDPLRVLPAVDGIVPVLGSQPLAVVPLICSHCGTIWQVSYPVIRTWLKENPPPEPKKDSYGQS